MTETKSVLVPLETGVERDLSSPISKALIVLDAVGTAETPPRFADLLTILPLSKATLHRMLKSLTNEEMLSLDQKTHTYRVGLRLLRLAHSAWSSNTLANVAEPVLDAVSQKLNMTVHLAVLDNYQVLYVGKRVPASSVQMYSSPGKIGPAYCTGVGKALLAHLPESQQEISLTAQSYGRHTSKTLTSANALRNELKKIAKHGYALDDEEHEQSIICVAAPIRNRNGTLLGALSATSTTFITTIDAMKDLAPTIIEAASQIGEAAEYQMKQA
ncbi:MAG: IclR family transcriptional regulator [Stappiaceae bacterium]